MPVWRRSTWRPNLMQGLKVQSVSKEDFNKWVQETQKTSPKLTKEQYDQLMLQGHAAEMTFSSTHLEWVNHVNDPEYAIRVRERLGQLPKGTVDSNGKLPDENSMDKSMKNHTGSH